MGKNYYAEKLSGDRLRRCYASAPERVRQYLKAEIEQVRQRIPAGSRVLELGCGFGRVLLDLITPGTVLFGIDTARDSLCRAQDPAYQEPFRLAQMNAARLGFRPNQFDLVFCIQNGIAVFGEDPAEVISESVRVLKPGATALFSSYSPKFWEHRLNWFRIQAALGLLGEIDERKSGAGIIVCKDGFKADAVSVAQFQAITKALHLQSAIFEVNDSAVFCEIRA